MRTLQDAELHNGWTRIVDNLKVCYRELIKASLLPSEEMRLVDAWCEDVTNLQQP